MNDETRLKLASTCDVVGGLVEWDHPIGMSAELKQLAAFLRSEQCPTAGAIVLQPIPPETPLAEDEEVWSERSGVIVVSHATLHSRTPLTVPFYRRIDIPEDQP